MLALLHAKLNHINLIRFASHWQLCSLAKLDHRNIKSYLPFNLLNPWALDALDKYGARIKLVLDVPKAHHLCQFLNPPFQDLIH